MKKKKWLGLSALALLAVAVLAGIVYKRPLTAGQMNPDLDLGACAAIRVAAQQNPGYRDPESVQPETRWTAELHPGDAGFDQLLGQMETGSFRRVISGLFIAENRKMARRGEDVWWTVTLCLADGRSLSIDNFYGAVTLERHDGARWVAADPAGGEAWLEGVWSLIRQYGTPEQAG